MARLLRLLPAFVAAFETLFAQYALVDAVGSPADAAATAADRPLWFVARLDAVPPFHIRVHMRDSVGAVRQRVAEAYGRVAGLLHITCGDMELRRPDASLWLEHLAGLAALLEATTRVRNPSSLCTRWSPCLTGCSASTRSGGAADEHCIWHLDELRHVLMELLQLQLARDDAWCESFAARRQRSSWTSPCSCARIRTPHDAFALLFQMLALCCCCRSALGYDL